MDWIKKHTLGMTLFSVASVIVAVAIGYFLKENKDREEEQKSGRIFQFKKRAA